MNRALFAAASGMSAQQRNLDTIAENLANADVAGFKGAQATFEAIAVPGGETLGTAQSGTHAIFTQGKLMRSDGPFDVAIDGRGFFVVEDDRGRCAYTRCGEFARGSDGRLRLADGRRLVGVTIPADATSVAVAADGRVTAQTPHGARHCGRIRLAEFAAPERMRDEGGTLFFATRDSGDARFIDAGASGGPQIRFDMLEQSNVTIVQAMMQILTAQRAYEANAKGVQAADELLRIADNLNRG